MENFLQRKSRTERRRHKTTGNHAQHDPKDSLIYLIYPPEPEAIDAVTIHHGDLKRLEDGVYFNDSLIDLTVKHRLAYSLKLYSVCDDIALSQRKAYAFSCLFYAKLTEGRGGKAAHDLVARWTKNVNIFEQDFIFFPINQGHHWSLVVIVRPALLLLEETAEEDDGSKEDAKEQVAEEDGEERLVAKKRKVAEELVEDDKREQLRRKKRSSAFDTTSNSDEMDEDSNSKRRRSSRLSSTKKVDIVTEETISPDKRKSTDNSNHSRKADANQTDKAIEITPPTLSKKVKKHNHACFLHLDSLNLHPTQSIYTTITSYLFFELEAIQNRTKTAAATTSAAGSSGEKTESGSDNEATNTATGKSADHKKSSPTHSTSSQSSSSSSKQKSKKVLEEKKTVELSSAESLKRFREKLEKVKCKVSHTDH